MALSLVITTVIPVLIFLPLGYLLKTENIDTSSWIGTFTLGSIGWIMYSVISFLPYYFLFTESSKSGYEKAIENHRTALFFIVLVLSVISEIIRFELFKSKYFAIKAETSTIVFGFGWGLAEFLARFLFFFDSSEYNYFLSTFLLLIFLIVSNAGLTTILIRSSENTKYVMFAAFIKFFVELALFGALGYEMSFTDRYARLYFFLFFQVIMFYLTMLTRKTTSIPDVDLA